MYFLDVFILFIFILSASPGWQVISSTVFPGVFRFRFFVAHTFPKTPFSAWS